MGFSSWSTTESISAYLVLFSTLLAIVLVLSKILHDRPVLSSVVPEAGLVLLVGMVAGGVVELFVDNDANADAADDDANEGVAQSLLSFSPEVFFIALLPPIIFNSGYHLRRELFFRLIQPIVLFAILGTAISSVSIAFLLKLVTCFELVGDFKPTLTELLTFGALISATDPVSTLAIFQAKRVDPQLFYLVFGESVLNDAVGLVLFNAFATFVARDNSSGKVAAGISRFLLDLVIDSICSPVLGLLLGCGAALIFRHVDMRSNRLLELSLYVLIMYVPFLLAQVLRLSGIVTILFTGMAARAYVVPNLSEVTATNANLLFRLAAHLAESSIFLELGLSVWGLTGSMNTRFIFWSLLACLIGRALNVYPITLAFNHHLQRRPEEKPDDKEEPESPSSKSNESHVEMKEMLSAGLYHANEDEGDGLSPATERQETGPTINSMDTLTPRVSRDLKIHNKTAHMLWFSGLRGAVAYACVRSFPDTFGNRNEFVMTTMVIVLVTVFALGGTTEVMLNRLQIESDIDEERYMADWHRERSSAGLVIKFEKLLHHYTVRQSLPEVSDDGKLRKEADDHAYHQHVEVTESEHINVVETMGKRRESLFDYGAKCD